MFNRSDLVCVFSAIVLVAAPCWSAAAHEKKYDPGASDVEIKIGNTMPYSGPASGWGLIGKAESAYFRKINAEGGVNGRKINFISYDDAYSPPKTVEQVRRLVESDEVLLLFSTFGVPTNSAIHKYVNARKIPQLFVGGGGSMWNDPKHFPWTMGFQQSFVVEGKTYGQYVAAHYPDGKIAVLYQHDDYGRDILNGLKLGLDGKASMIVAEVPYEVTEPTIDSQVARLKASGADIFMNFSGPKFAAQAIRKVAELGWKPLHIINIPSASIGTVLKPAGLDISQGIITGAFLKDVNDPAMAEDPGVKNYRKFLAQYYPEADLYSPTNALGYVMAQVMIHVLREAGDDLTRENIMRQASTIRDLEVDMLLPSVRVSTTPEDFAPLKRIELRRFVGDRWQSLAP